jgi:hypothetical protein
MVLKKISQTRVLCAGLALLVCSHEASGKEATDAELETITNNLIQQIKSKGLRQDINFNPWIDALNTRNIDFAPLRFSPSALSHSAALIKSSRLSEWKGQFFWDNSGTSGAYYIKMSGPESPNGVKKTLVGRKGKPLRGVAEKFILPVIDATYGQLVILESKLKSGTEV